MHGRDQLAPATASSCGISQISSPAHVTLPWLGAAERHVPRPYTSPDPELASCKGAARRTQGAESPAGAQASSNSSTIENNVTAPV